MSIEERAEQWVKNNTDESVNSFNGEELRKAYIAGYKQGRADESINAVEQMNSRIKELHSDLTHKGYAVIQWHKVADGLPISDEDKIYLVKDKWNCYAIARYFNGEWSNYTTIEDVIAWKEIILPEE